MCQRDDIKEEAGIGRLRREKRALLCDPEIQCFFLA